MLRGMLYGYFIAALVIGALAAIGFGILGFQYAALLGALTTVAALIPFVGPKGVFAPLAVIEFMTGSRLIALSALVYGIVVLTGYTNIYLYPKLGGKYAGIHPILMLIAFMGGPLSMGPTGLVFGPLAMGLALGLAESVRLWGALAALERAVSEHG
jgi:predicted PurR-regulated permease PerM